MTVEIKTLCTGIQGFIFTQISGHRYDNLIKILEVLNFSEIQDHFCRYWCEFRMPLIQKRSKCPVTIFGQQKPWHFRHHFTEQIKHQVVLLWWSWFGWLHYSRADSRFVPSQWETLFLCNDVSNWLGASLESALLQWQDMSIETYHITGNQMLAQQFVQANIKDIIKALHSWSFVRRIHQ